MSESQKTNFTDRLSTPILGLLTLIMTIMALIPAFLSLNDKEAKIFYSVKSFHINIPSTLNVNQALSTLENAGIPGSTFEMSLINQGNALADSIRFEIEVPNEILAIWSEPPKKSNPIWVDIPELKFSSGDKKIQAEIKNFYATKPLRILIGYRHYPNEKPKISVFSNGKHASSVEDIQNVSPWSKWDVFYFPFHVFFGGMGFILLWSLIVALINNPSFRNTLLNALTESANIGLGIIIPIKLISEFKVIGQLNKAKLPMTPEQLIDAINKLDSLDLFKNKKVKINVSIKKKDETILKGFYFGSHGQNVTKGYRYSIDSQMGTSQEFWIKDVDSVLKFKVIKSY